MHGVCQVFRVLFAVIAAAGAAASGKTISIPARKYAAFKPGKTLKEKVSK